MKMIKSIIFIIAIMITGTAYGSSQLSQTDIYWLAKNIYYEARGESVLGQIMVGVVTISRQQSGEWGDTIKAVVTAPKQFSWYDPDKKAIPKNKKSWIMAKKIAILSCVAYCILGEPKIQYYHNLSAHPKWADRLQKVLVVENHIFYEKKS